MSDDHDELTVFQFGLRCATVYWHRDPSCTSRGPHGAQCVRDPGHRGRWCEGNGNPDPYGPSYYRWENPRG
jgi:hypothetical protein